MIDMTDKEAEQEIERMGRGEPVTRTTLIQAIGPVGFVVVPHPGGEASVNVDRFDVPFILKPGERLEITTNGYAVSVIGVHVQPLSADQR